VSRFGQKVFQPAESREGFAVEGEADYRVEVEFDAGAQLFSFGSLIEAKTGDPSFVPPRPTTDAKVYFIGMMSTPGPNGSLWRSDLVLAHVGTSPATTQAVFLPVGPFSEPLAAKQFTVTPGQTRRLANVIAGEWGVTDTVGVLTLTSDALDGVFPLAQGSSYDTANTLGRYGQTVPPVTDADAASPGQSQYLTGLRQNTTHRSTVWLFNPDAAVAEYDLVYRSLDGEVLDRVNGFRVPSGRVRQLSAGQHPVAVAGDFTLQAVVKTGKLLMAAQVVNNNNDPSYARGQTSGPTP
jgi:hypothetical protein